MTLTSDEAVTQLPSSPVSTRFYNDQQVDALANQSDKWLDARLSSIPGSRKFAFTTWARTFTCYPLRYFEPTCIQDVQIIVHAAQRYRIRLCVVGSGHSPSELTCTSGWMISLDRMNRFISVEANPHDPCTNCDNLIREKLCTLRQHDPDVHMQVQAGIRLRQLIACVRKYGLTISSLGSIDEQSIAGALATATHGGSLYHGLLSESVCKMKIVLANSYVVECSAEHDLELFRAALVSLGALGILVEVTLRLLPTSNVSGTPYRVNMTWSQCMLPLSDLLATWKRNPLDFWGQTEFIRVFWLPHTRRAIVWRGNPTALPAPPEDVYSSQHLTGYQSFIYKLVNKLTRKLIAATTQIGRLTHYMLLYVAHFIPRLNRTIEWLVFGIKCGFSDYATKTGICEFHEAQLIDCLFSQVVNEWGIPLSCAPAAIESLDKWLNREEIDNSSSFATSTSRERETLDTTIKADDATDSRQILPVKIPFSASGVYAHAPIEVRVVYPNYVEATAELQSQTSPHTSSKLINRESGSMETRWQTNRPYLDPSQLDEPTVYINMTLYRPGERAPVCTQKLYAAFEFVMHHFGGRPHWAKNFLHEDDWRGKAAIAPVSVPGPSLSELPLPNGGLKGAPLSSASSTSSFLHVGSDEGNSVPPPSSSASHKVTLVRPLAASGQSTAPYNTSSTFLKMYSSDLLAWRKVRARVDPKGVFVGPWLRRTVLGYDSGQDSWNTDSSKPSSDSLTEEPDSDGSFVFQRVSSSAASGGPVKDQRSGINFSDTVARSTLPVEETLIMDSTVPHHAHSVFYYPRSWLTGLFCGAPGQIVFRGLLASQRATVCP